ncbi:MAG: hypothetical protein WCQ69_01740 [Bacteroidales bacterium]|jgi:sirohydrochlorin ferrochelatase|nr:DUF4834 family protein [Bacteroidales bacterium]MDD2263926.1 hypothetical protein [Bacteroidales bacterium]MDD2831160.1 hypothetical protein [Bacteroidales bacterium]MDD3209271.1 hypothetical protein [Bacteroidales bacterium]MDD3697602.1 hypothetical protein [Bacteroidales bacterium]
MTFLTLILFFILAGYFFVRLIPGLLALKMRKMQQHGQKQEKTEFKKSRKKHIGQDTGEYVDYEEIEN